ncbi:hypothetical protein BHE74_00012851 [Ensete ventricosum]|nr:hypothetical protein GW17_00025183 [Ensete ventricosum]RWW78897.1 hypothetical protein BHE74_00012851 [Ensete ventricosum]
MGNRMNMVLLKNMMVINFAQSRGSIKFSAPSWKFKILPIPNVLAYGKSHEHNFTKKCDDHKLYAKSRCDWFFA